MAEDQGHQALIRFIRKVIDVPGAHTKDDLIAFRDAASRAYPALVPVIDAYVYLAGESRRARHRGSLGSGRFLPGHRIYLTCLGKSSFSV